MLFFVYLLTMGYDIKTGEGKVNVEIETKVGIKNILTPDILMRCT